jgi:hypothetical protein
MKRKSAIAIAIALFVFAASTALYAEPAKVGQKAPDFTLKDQNGKEVKLADFKGKTVVLEWLNANCPYVKRHYEAGTMTGLAKQYTKGGKVVTRPADNGILRGITRTVLIEVIEAHGLQFEERPFTVEEAQGAREAFLTSASQIVMPVVRIDDRPVGNGAPGSVATALRAEFHRHAERR